jgi:hypothetical protein
MTTPVTHDDSVMDSPDVTPTFSMHTSWRECPRCAAETHGRRECPTCTLLLDDATLEAHATRLRDHSRRQQLALAGIALVTFTTIAAGGVGFRLGARSVVAASIADSVTGATAQRRYWQSLPAQTRFQLHAQQLQLLFNPKVATIAAIDFKPVSLPDQPARPGVPDLTVVFQSDSAWRTLAKDERQVMLTALSRTHQSFLAFSGLRDTLQYAVMVKSRVPGDADRILALRDRNGNSFFK